MTSSEIRNQVWSPTEPQERLIAWRNGDEVDLSLVRRTVLRTMLKDAWVEVSCATNHSNIWIPGNGWSCRYARGTTTHKKHQCHLCSCFRLLPALTPSREQVCDNCGGPLATTKTGSVWPDILMLSNFAMSTYRSEASR